MSASDGEIPETRIGGDALDIQAILRDARIEQEEEGLQADIRALLDAGGSFDPQQGLYRDATGKPTLDAAGRPLA